MSSYSFVSTGLSSGIGGVARPIIESDHPDLHHIMICRNPEKVTISKNLTLIKCDLRSIDSVKQAVSQIIDLVNKQKVPPIKYILNNAGAGYVSRCVKTVDGFEATFQINVIAPYILISALLPYLKQTPDPRVFITGSNSHFADKEHNHGMLPKPYWNDKNLDEVMLPIATKVDSDPKSLEAGLRAYGTSKLAILYLAYKFARENKEIKFVIYEPGFVPTTGLLRNVNFLMRLMLRPIGLVFLLLGWSTTISKAGKNLAHFAFDEDMYSRINNVAYCDQGNIVKSSEESYLESRQDQLWNELVKRV